jgi:hypothetical protein
LEVKVLEQMFVAKAFIRRNLRNQKFPCRRWPSSGASSRGSKKLPPKSMRHARCVAKRLMNVVSSYLPPLGIFTLIRCHERGLKMFVP